MRMPEDELAKERQMFVDLWEYRKRFWGAEDNDDYWDEVVSEANALGMKYGHNPYFDAVICANIADFERRGKRQPTPVKGKALVSLSDGAQVPERGTVGSAGYDLRTVQDVTIRPGEVEQVHTGFHVQPTPDVVGLMFIRSGLSRLGLRLSTGVSVIDSDYTGEVIACIHNIGDEEVKLSIGDRVCQIVFLPFLAPQLEVVDALPETERGGGGFGSTGR